MHFGFLKRVDSLTCVSISVDMQKLFWAPCEAEAGISAPFICCWESYKSFSTAITRKD